MRARASARPRCASAGASPSRSASARSISASRAASGRGKATESSCSIGAESRPVADSTPGMRRNGDPRDARSAPAPRVQRAAAAQRHERVVRGSSPGGSWRGACLGHQGVEDTVGAERRGSERAPERTRRASPISRGRGRDRASRFRRRNSPDRLSEDHRSVGDGRLDAAPAVAGGARLRSGRLRPDPEHAASVEPRLLPPPAPIAVMSTMGTRTV